jgi:hypothetical protein
MKCPVCGKHVAEERFELHVGRHTHAAPTDEVVTTDGDAVPAPAEETGRAPVAAAAAGVDSGALLLGPRGDPMPLAEGEADELDGPAAAGVDETPAVDGDAVIEDDTAAETVVDDETIADWDDKPAPLDATAPLDGTAPLDATAPLPYDAPPAWDGPSSLPAAPVSRRRSTLPLLGLVALVAVAAVIAYALSSDDETKPASPARVRTAATSTTVVTFPPFGAAPQPTAPPAALPPTVPPASIPTAVPPVPPGGGLTTPPPGAGGGTGQIQVLPNGAVCDEDSLTVTGTVANNSGPRYNVTFSVTVVSASGQPLGTARTTVAGLNPGERRPFQASGTCSGTLSSSDRAQVQIESVTPA